MKPILGLSTSAQRPSPCVLVPIPERESVVDAAWGRYASLDQVEVGTVVGLGPFQRDHQSVDRHPRGSVTLDNRHLHHAVEAAFAKAKNQSNSPVCEPTGGPNITKSCRFLSSLLLKTFLIMTHS